MQTGDVTYERDGATLRAYSAWPEAAGRLPALVLIPDVRGLSDHYRDVARRWASEGFFTLAVDLYSREGAPELPEGYEDKARDLARKRIALGGFRLADLLNRLFE